VSVPLLPHLTSVLAFWPFLTLSLHPDPCSFYQSPQKHPLLGQRSQIAVFVKRSKFCGLFRSSLISSLITLHALFLFQFILILIW
jgi:hypothetical protein